MNQVAVVNGIAVTLLSYVVVDDTIRLHGAVRITGDHEPRLMSVPALSLTRVDDACPLPPLGAHVLPRPPIIWLAWMFGLVGFEPRGMAARIEQLQFGYRTGKKTDVVVGPWLFELIAPEDLDPMLRPGRVED